MLHGVEQVGGMSLINLQCHLGGVSHMTCAESRPEQFHQRARAEHVFKGSFVVSAAANQQNVLFPFKKIGRGLNIEKGTGQHTFGAGARTKSP